jgi:hypothetical protein
MGQSDNPVTRRGFVQAAICLPVLRHFFIPRAALASEKIGLEDDHASGALNYHPSGMYVWDSWYFTKGDEVHVIHLQKKRPQSQRSDRDAVALGHAVSLDFLTWTELPIPLYPGLEGSIDDLDLFTGCTFAHAGTFYLYYTARKRSEQGRVQRLCVATSQDALHWKKQSGPIIIPDSRWYETGDCRDLMVVQDPDGGKFHGFFTARVRSDELTKTAVVAHAISYDLIRWEQTLPVFAPGRYGILEEPDVFYLHGRWWIICATGNFDGVRGDYHDRYATYGTIYGSAAAIDGPYTLGSETLLLGSKEFNGFSCRTVMWKGRRYAMYSQSERQNREDGGSTTLGCLTTPKELDVHGDRLYLKYSPLIETRFEGPLFDSGSSVVLTEVPYGMSDRRFGTAGVWEKKNGLIHANSPRSWSARLCGPDSPGFLWSAEVCLDSGRAIGLIFRRSLVVYLDFEGQCVASVSLPMLSLLDARDTTLVRGVTYRLRILAKAEFIEVYLDEALILSYVRYQPSSGPLGLYIEAGQGTFANLQVAGIRVA